MTIDDSLCLIFLKLEPRRIVFLKFVLESYEGLGILRTLDPVRGEVVIIALRDTEKTLRELLATLEDELKHRLIDPPQSVHQDWLLSQHLSGL